jgi:hypothetical protein
MALDGRVECSLVDRRHLLGLRFERPSAGVNFVKTAAKVDIISTYRDAFLR